MSESKKTQPAPKPSTQPIAPQRPATMRINDSGGKLPNKPKQ
jgi:hypothetical protein